VVLPGRNPGPGCRSCCEGPAAPLNPPTPVEIITLPCIPTFSASPGHHPSSLARFVTRDTLAILYEWGIVEGIDLRDQVAGGKAAFAIDVRTRDDERLRDKTIAASPHGRFLVVGQDTAFNVIDLQKRT
jgi:hypothetical protein